MLTALFFIPLIGALSLLFVNKNESLIKRITLGTTILNFFISLILWGKFDNNTHEYQFVQDFAEISFCHFYVGIDGISLFFVLLTTFLFPIIILVSWNHKNNIIHYFLYLLILESLLIATFIVLDLLLFYIFFESILIPLFIIIIIYGDSLTKEKAGFMLFLYTLFGSLFMLLAIITILILTGTTDFQILSTINFGTDIQKLLFAGFLLAFIVKTPLIPTHIWLGFAHVAAPIGGSVLLAGVILKLATYLALRVMIPYFPEATLYFTPLIYTLAVISIIYASLTCLRLIDVKAIIAYSSISHMGVVVLGLFSNNLQGIEGAIILGLAHGVISPLLFIIVGDILYVRSHTRIIKYYRGLASSTPILSLIFFFATLANIGTPFSGNFIGEFMSYAGAFQTNPIITILGATGMFLSAAYSIWLFNRICFGSASRYLSTIPDISRREFFVLLPLIVVSFILGVYPNVVFDSLHLAVSSLLISVNTPMEIVLSFLPAFILLNKEGSNKDRSIEELKILHSSLTPEFKKWFVGFTDAEGCFIIRYNKTIIQSLTFHCHIDELPLFYKLKELLGGGCVSLESNSVKYIISNYNQLTHIIIPIFEEYHLNTSKYLNYEDFKLVLGMRENKEHLLAGNKEKILRIKAGMNSLRLNGAPHPEISINWNWLLGFIEGDGSFCIADNRPQLVVHLTASEKGLLLAIKNFLKEGNILDSKATPLKLISNPNAKSTVHLNIFKLNYFIDYLIPEFDKLNFYTKKYLDYLDWKKVVYLVKDKKHLTSKGVLEINNIKLSMNNNRLSNKKSLIP